MTTREHWELQRAINNVTAIENAVNHLAEQVAGERKLDPAYRAALAVQRDKLTVARQHEAELRQKAGA
ncbi:MAG: hypothetical protein ACLQM8_04445 [Limisphaerales bacterium]